MLVFTNGCFKILHAGHVDLLEHARALGDRLGVGLNSDASVRAIKGPPRPLVREDDRCLGKMRDVARQGRTVLFVSHNLTALASLCSRSIYLRDGQIRCDSDSLSCIHRYMRDFQSTSGVSSFNQQLKELPEDPVCQVTDFEFAQLGEPTTEVLSNTGIHVTITYEVKQPVCGLRVGFDIIDNNGTVIFRTLHDDLAEEIDEVSPGVYKSTAVIPANLLTPGPYSLSLVLGVQNVRWIIIDQIMYEFQVSNIEGVSAHYADDRPGVILPDIPWQTRTIGLLQQEITHREVDEA